MDERKFVPVKIGIPIIMQKRIDELKEFLGISESAIINFMLCKQISLLHSTPEKFVDKFLMHKNTRNIPKGKKKVIRISSVLYEEITVIRVGLCQKCEILGDMVSVQDVILRILRMGIIDLIGDENRVFGDTKKRKEIENFHKIDWIEVESVRKQERCNATECTENEVKLIKNEDKIHSSIWIAKLRDIADVLGVPQNSLETIMIAQFLFNNPGICKMIELYDEDVYKKIGNYKRGRQDIGELLMNFHRSSGDSNDV